MADPFLSLPGAVESPGLGTPAHYGSPLPEQRAFARGEAIISLSHHGVVTVTGPDRLSWLDSMTSQSLRGLTPGVSTESLLLDPQGHIEQVLRVVDDGEQTWLLVDADAHEALTAYLHRMRFALRVEVHDRSAELATVAVWSHGPAEAALAELDVALVQWRDPWSVVAPGGAQYAAAPHAGEDWAVAHVVVPRSQLGAVAELVRSGAASVAGLLALDALEIRAWRPSLRGEVDERALPHEFDWLRSAVHLNKGCYRGQETVAKVHNLGHPPRRLVLLHLDGSRGELPEPGALVYEATQPQDPAAKPVGRITRAALHYEWGAIALALLKRSAPEDATLVVAGPDGEWISASQEVIVPSDAGRTRAVPRMRRL